jgi:tetratricopeptide (TPR) repeat protein
MDRLFWNCRTVKNVPLRKAGGAALLIASMLALSACSTQPKNPSDIYTLRRQAESQLELADKQAGRGDYAAALVLLNEAMRMAVSADDPGLRIRAGLSRGNVFFSLGRPATAASDWENALAEAEQRGGKELVSVSRIHIARGRLFSGGELAVLPEAAGAQGRSPASGESRADFARSIRDEVSREIGNIKSSPLYTAFAWIVIGLAEKDMGSYGAAESAVRRSLEIHEKTLSLEQAAYDWFLIASFRSLSGDYSGARRALDSAIAFDRRVENSYGLASDWRALGDIYKKEGNLPQSYAAYLRSAEIFRAMGNDAAAAEALGRLD